MNITSHVHTHHSPRSQRNWDKWELIIMKQCCGNLPKEQISNILIFLGSNRSPKAVNKQAHLLGRSIRVKKVVYN